ncbi:MAG: hypothetical protein IKP75_10130 [Oscillospiraceae bacterium]|nr:hypothetical protein [Oscillospiraceae bacterium]
MTKLDLYWESNKGWYYTDKDGVAHLKDDAPQKAKESYKHYLEQMKRCKEQRKKSKLIL